MTKILACDPGMKGGFAWNDKDGNVCIQKMPVVYDRVVERVKNGKTSINPKTGKTIYHTDKSYKKVRNDIETSKSIRDFMKKFANSGYEFWSEKVGKPINHDRIRVMNMNAVATFAHHIGVLEQTAHCFYMELKQIHSKKWQEELGDFTHGLDNFARTKRKSEINRKVKELYPNLKGITLDTADALGIFHIVNKIYNEE